MQESMKRVFVCPKCGTRALAVNSCVCSRCNVSMTPVPYDISQWSRLTPQQQNGVVQHWMKTSEWINLADTLRVTNASEAAGSAPPPPPPPPPAAGPSSPVYGSTASTPSSPWIALLRGVVYVILIGGILASLYFGSRMFRYPGVLMGLLVIVLGTLASLLSVAGIMIFLDMAADLRRIRSILERNGKN